MSEYNEIMDGGILAGGEIDCTASYEEIMLSGVFCNGSVDLSNIFQTKILSFGVLARNFPALTEYTYNGTSIISGGTKCSGNSKIYVDYNIDQYSNGIVCSGLSNIKIIILMQGGVTLNGESENSLDFITKGGVKNSGYADVTSFVNEPVFGRAIKGIKASGLAFTIQERLTSVIIGGSVTTSGSAGAGIKSAHVRSSGSITVATEPISPNFIFNYDFNFNWRLNAMVVKDVRFLWNLGQLTVYWYRVVGKGTTSNCLPQDPCCQKFILNVHARSLSELCQRLSQRRYKFPIDFVQRFSRPAENTVVASEEAAGIKHDCNNLIDVEVCNIPECADFCVQEDLLLNFGFNMKVQINAFKFHEAFGSAFVQGVADFKLVKNLPQLKFVASGEIVTSGNAYSNTDHHKMRGGIKLGGQSKSSSSRWNYLGGVWPNQTPINFGTQTQSLLQNPNEQIWSLTDRICAYDGSYSSTDISYGKTSQLLIAKNFGFNLPDWSKILNIKVNINRFSSNVGVRDKEIYLIKNNQRISDNLATTTTDWPLIETIKEYGTNGWRSPLLEGFLEDFTAAEINDPSFGLAIKINSTSANLICIAQIDFVNIQISYEDANGSLVRISSQGSIAAGPTYHTKSEGKISLGSQSTISVKRRFLQRVKSSGVNLAGQSFFVEEFLSSGGVALGSEAKVDPILEIPSGGLVVAFAEATVKPEWHTMSGGISASAESDINTVLNIESIANVILAGSATVTSKQFFYSSDGGVDTSGSSKNRHSSWKYFTEGDSVLTYGGADFRGGNFNLNYENVGFNMSVSQITATFLSDVDLNNLNGLTENLVRCGCFNLPLKIQFSHNFSVNNNFSKFLVRNNFNLSKNLVMNYNLPNDSWQTNFHYKGKSAENNQNESWDFTAELNCTNFIGGIVLGTSVWRLALQFVRKNLNTGESFDSRILLGVIPDAICSSAVSLLDFLVEYDTQSKIAIVSPAATVYQCTVYDNIGLFKNPSWVASPILQLKVSQASTIQSQTRYDLTKSVLT